jgi:hypothetical protein
MGIHGEVLWKSGFVKILHGKLFSVDEPRHRRKILRYFLRRSKMKKTLILMMAVLILWTSSVQAELVGYWTFNGDTLDSSGYGNDGTAFGGASYTIGNDALIFDGTDDYVEVAPSSSLNFTTAYSIEARL